MTMSEHAWVLENIAVYHAGGLEPGECERLQQHTAVCASCAQALEEASRVDGTLEALFAEVRPDPALEDRMIHALRAVPVWRNWPTLPWIATGAAAVVLLGVLGAGVSHLVARGAVLFPGMLHTWARAQAI